MKLTKIFFCIFAAVLVLCILKPVWAAEGIDGGSCGDNAGWTLAADGTLTVFGEGKLDDWSTSQLSAPWCDYREDISFVVVENGITSIGNGSFVDCVNMTGIVIPESVTDIGACAFSGCTRLTDITIPDGVTAIRYGLLKGCSSLKNIEIPKGVTVIEFDAFRDCTGLMTVRVPESLTVIEETAFRDCTGLTGIDMPEGLMKIGREAFYGCANLTSIELPDSITVIDAYTFAECECMQSVMLPRSLTNIEHSAFAQCRSLRSVDLPEGLVSLGRDAFQGCLSLEGIGLPEGLQVIWRGTFTDCASLQWISVPQSITQVEQEAFHGCHGLKTVYYAGNETQWQYISVGSANEPLKKAECRTDTKCVHSFSKAVGDGTAHNRTCSLCADRLTAAHIWGSWEITVSPTNQTSGQQRRLCRICAMEETESAPACEVPAPHYPLRTQNIDTHFYFGHAASPVTSTLVLEGERYTRVEYNHGKIVVEQYDMSLKFLSRRDFPLELPIYGGVYIGENWNFVICGQKNDEESSWMEVIRIVRYDKNWNRLDSAGVYGANTTLPFRSGSLRAVEYGNQLHIRTSHRMYTSVDGLQHQANMVILLDIPTMTAQVPEDGTYVSHSFDQYVALDGQEPVSVDLGDAYPRAVVLFKAGRSGETLLRIPGEIGDNFTGVQLGGMGVSRSHYLVAGVSSVLPEEDGWNPNGQMNVFVTATAKDAVGEGKSRVLWLTEYSEGISVSPPHLVKLSDDRFVLLWTEGEQVRFCFINGQGELEGELFSGEGALSDCVPIMAGNSVLWYVTNYSEPVFYRLNLETNALVKECTDHIFRNGVCTVCGLMDDSAQTGKSIPGDADGSGVVDYIDAMLVLQAAVGLHTLDPVAEALSNVNGDDTVDYLDAMTILQAAVGMITLG